MTIFYNLMPLIVTVKMKKEGIVDNKGFYDNADVMRRWTAYLIINLVTETIIAMALCIVTIQTILTIKRFFRDQYFK